MKALHCKPYQLAKLIVILSSILLLSEEAYCQEKQPSSWYDSLTYSCYLRQDWSCVIKNGDMALSKGYDFYYLRMRIANAFFEKGNFMASSHHYSKALKFNTGDGYARSGSYFSYMNMGDYDQATRVVSYLSKEDMKLWKIPSRRFFDFIYLETGNSFSSMKENASWNKVSGNSLYKERDFQKDLFFTQFGAKIRVLPSLAVFAGFSTMNIRREKQFSFSTVLARRDSIRDEIYGKDYYYSLAEKRTDTSFSYNSQQNGIYVNASLLSASGLKFTSALHLLLVKTRNIYSSYQIKTLTDTAYYLSYDSSWHLFEYTRGNYIFGVSDSSFNNFIFSLSVSKDIGKLKLETFGSVSDFYGRKQLQAGLSVIWYPFGNSSLYGAFNATTIFADSKQRMVYEPSLGFKLGKRIWLSGLATIGNLDLYNEKNASIVYNQPETVVFRTGGNALILLGKHIEIGFFYRFLKKEFLLTEYLKDENNGINPLLVKLETKQTYSNHSLTGGIKWKF